MLQEPTGTKRFPFLTLITRARIRLTRSLIFLDFRIDALQYLLGSICISRDWSDDSKMETDFNSIKLIAPMNTLWRTRQDNKKSKIIYLCLDLWKKISQNPGPNHNNRHFFVMSITNNKNSIALFCVSLDSTNCPFFRFKVRSAFIFRYRYNFIKQIFIIIHAFYRKSLYPTVISTSVVNSFMFYIHRCYFALFE